MSNQNVVSTLGALAAAAALLSEPASLEAASFPTRITPIRIPPPVRIVPAPRPYVPPASKPAPPPASHPAQPSTHPSPAAAPHPAASPAHSPSEPHPAAAPVHVEAESKAAQPSPKVAPPSNLKISPEQSASEGESGSVLASGRPFLSNPSVLHLNGFHPLLLPPHIHGLGSGNYLYSVTTTNHGEVKILSPEPLSTNASTLKGEFKQIGAGTNAESFFVVPATR